MAIKKKKKKKESLSANAIPVSEAQYKRVEPDEFYTAKFIKCHIEEGKYGPYARLEFELLNGNVEDSSDSAKGLKMSAFCPANVTPKNSAWDIFKGILGKDPVIDEPIDVVPYYGKKYKVLVSDNRKGDEVRQLISKIKPIKKKIRDK